MDHGHLMLSTNCAVLFDLVVCEATALEQFDWRQDPEMRGRASGVLYNIAGMPEESQNVYRDLLRSRITRRGQPQVKP